MRVLAIVHQPDAGPGVFADAVRAAGAQLDEWRPPEEEVPNSDHDAVMVFGGAMDAHQEELHPWLRGEKAFLAELLAQRVPVLGVCLGAQLLAEAAGGETRRAREPEIGWREVVLEASANSDPLLAPLPRRFASFQWHSYEAVAPPGAVVLACSEVCAQAFRLEGRVAWGIQFHAEVTSEIVESWIREYHKDPDAVRIGLDFDQLLEETRPAIGAWNELGRDLCGRFLEQAAATRA